MSESTDTVTSKSSSSTIQPVIDYYRQVRRRVLYELALLVQTLPHLMLKHVLLSWGAMYVFRNLAYMRHVQGPRLKDLGFELVPESDNDFWSEFSLYTNGVVAYFMLLQTILADHAHAQGVFGVRIFMKIVNIQCVGHILRFLSYISTSLPGPAAHCQPGTAPLYRSPDSWTLETILTRRSKVHIDPNCGDLIFSGHMFQVTSFCVVLCSYSSTLFGLDSSATKGAMRFHALLGRVARSILILTILVQPYFIVAARNHYSVDVVISAYVAPMTWWAMEGFYSTAFYQSCAAWWVRLGAALFPRAASYVQRCNPTVKKNTEEDQEFYSHLITKYNMDVADVKRLRRLVPCDSNAPSILVHRIGEPPSLPSTVSNSSCASSDEDDGDEEMGDSSLVMDRGSTENDSMMGRNTFKQRQAVHRK